jgi:preprotein translocase subunit SecA
MQQEELVKQARMRAATQRVPAALAFDQKKRVDALRAAQEAAGAPAASAPAKPSAPSASAAPAQAQPAERRAPAAAGLDTPPAGRNDPCPCGSGKKYKKCHGQGL